MVYEIFFLHFFVFVVFYDNSKIHKLIFLAIQFFIYRCFYRYWINNIDGNFEEYQKVELIFSGNESMQISLYQEIK